MSDYKPLTREELTELAGEADQVQPPERGHVQRTAHPPGGNRIRLPWPRLSNRCGRHGTVARWAGGHDGPG